VTASIDASFAQVNREGVLAGPADGAASARASIPAVSPTTTNSATSREAAHRERTHRTAVTLLSGRLSRALGSTVVE
jgi:hypothetical protein